MSTQGLMALPTQWEFAEGRRPGSTATRVSRSDWRVLLSWHIAESREQAQRRGPAAGLMRWHNEYNVATAAAAGPEAVHVAGGPPWRRPPAAKAAALHHRARRTIWSKPIKETDGSLRRLSAPSSAFVHDWANPENTRRSWGHGGALCGAGKSTAIIDGLRKSQKFLVEKPRGV